MTDASLDIDIPYEIEYHETISSTNDRARDLAAGGEREVVVRADTQTGGRGRRDRSWASPPGGLWVSVLVRPDASPARASLYTLAAAIATTRAVRNTGIEAGIKWPNDVLVRETERKLAGIRTEARAEAGRLVWLIVGIGLNANVDPEALPPGATSLSALGNPVSRRDVLEAVVGEFDALRDDLDRVIPVWKGLQLTLGRRVRVETVRRTITGDARTITAEGALVVDTEDGPEIVRAGDCEHLRPV